MALRHTIFHCNLICLFKTSLQILTVFAITLYFSHNVFLSRRIPGIVKHVFVYRNRFNGIMNDDILSQDCIYKSLSNFCFLPLFACLWDWSEGVLSLSVFCVGQGRGGGWRELLLLMHRLAAKLPRAHPAQPLTFLKWKPNKQKPGP